MANDDLLLFVGYVVAALIIIYIAKPACIHARRLSYNKLSGTLPHELGALSRLSQL